MRNWPSLTIDRSKSKWEVLVLLFLRLLPIRQTLNMPISHQSLYMVFWTSVIRSRYCLLSIDNSNSKIQYRFYKQHNKGVWQRQIWCQFWSQVLNSLNVNKMNHLQVTFYCGLQLLQLLCRVLFIRYVASISCKVLLSVKSLSNHLSLFCKSTVYEFMS